MTIQMVTSTIQLILAPVVMVSACAILLTGLLNRYAGVNDRLRAMTRERLDLVFAAPPVAALAHERLREIDIQLPQLLHRHRTLRDAALALYSAVLVFVLCMFGIALAAATNSAWAATGALIIFLAGTTGMGIGIGLVALEVRTSDRAIQYEVARVGGLDAPPGPAE